MQTQCQKAVHTLTNSCAAPLAQFDDVGLTAMYTPIRWATKQLPDRCWTSGLFISNDEVKAAYYTLHRHCCNEAGQPSCLYLLLEVVICRAISYLTFNEWHTAPKPMMPYLQLAIHFACNVVLRCCCQRCNLIRGIEIKAGLQCRAQAEPTLFAHQVSIWR